MSELKVKVLEAPIFEGVAQDLVLKSNNVNRIVIANTGPVSIQSNLSYSGTLTGNTGVINIGSGQIYKDASGNVGIGTSTPIYKLHVSDSTAANSNTDIIGMTSSYFSNAKKSLTWFSGTDAVGRISTVFNTLFGEVGVDMTFGSLYNISAGMNDSELMRLTSGGRLGIGTPLPDSLLTVNGVASFAAGSASSPSIARAGDLNTGIFFPAADTIAFTEGGVEAMRINSDGNVGIGSTSPVTAIEIIKTTPTITLSPSAYSGAYRTTLGTRSGAEAFLIFGNNNQNEIRAGRTAVGGYLDFYTNNTVGQESASDGVLVMRMTSSGNVGIGTSSPATKLQVSGGSTTEIRFVSSGNLNSGGASFLRFGGSNNAASGYVGYGGTASTYDIWNGLNGAITFGTNDVERMRITSDGNLLVGTTDTGFNTRQLIRFEASGTSTRGLVVWNGGGAGAQFIGFSNSGGGIIGSITSSGTTAVAYNTTSDHRLKENVAPMTAALEKVAALKPVTYTWKTDGSDGQGFIAHELQAVVPDCVTGTKDAVDAEGNPQYQGVDTSFLVATLVAAIQELTARLEVLENK